MAGYTKLQWEIQPETRLSDGYYITNFVDGEICRLIKNIDDARLMSFAPDMYEALKEADRTFTAFGIVGEAPNRVRKILSVLATVEGK